MRLMWLEFKKPSVIGQTNQNRNQAISVYFLLSFLVSILVTSNCFAEIIKSRAALTIDASTGEILFSKNSSWRLPPASTTKLMTAIVALENEDLSKVVTISKKASRAARTKAGFKEGDQITIEGLLYAALLGSANDAAVALAEAIAGSEQRFVPLMNEKALSIGAEDTKFINATGLPGDGQYTTALDLSRILSYALRLSKLREIIGTPEAKIKTEKGKAFSLKSTDKLLSSDEKIIGGKTGYTHMAGHCFVCAAQGATRTILVAILGSPSRKNLWRETEKLVSRNVQGSPSRKNLWTETEKLVSRNVQESPPIKFSPLAFSLRRLLYDDSSFYFLLSPSQEQSLPSLLLQPAS